MTLRALMHSGIVVILLAFSACAGMQADWQAQYCNHDGAYEKGMNDARSGGSMNSISQSCPPETQAAVAAGYREGFTAGLASAPPMPVQVVGPPPGGIVVYEGAPPSQPNGWFCEVRPFTDHFEAFGATQLEAREKVRQRCLRRYNDMFCNKTECRPNQ